MPASTSEPPEFFLFNTMMLSSTSSIVLEISVLVPAISKLPVTVTFPVIVIFELLPDIAVLVPPS